MNGRTAERPTLKASWVTLTGFGSTPRNNQMFSYPVHEFPFLGILCWVFEVRFVFCSRRIVVGGLCSISEFHVWLIILSRVRISTSVLETTHDFQFREGPAAKHSTSRNFQIYGQLFGLFEWIWASKTCEKD